MKQGSTTVVTVSWLTLFRILAFVIGIFAVVALREIILLLFGVFIFVAAVNPTVVRLQDHMSRPLAIGVIYAGFFAVLAISISFLIPSLVAQLNDLVRSLPQIVEAAKPWLASFGGSESLIEEAVQGVKSNLNVISQNLINATFGVFGGLVTVFTGIVLSFYLLLEENNAKEFFHQVLPHHRYEAVYNTVNKISEKLGFWVRGQLILMAVVGLANLVIYIILGVQTPLPLAIWAGLCEMIPMVGPLIGVLPAVAIALATGSVLQAVLVVLLGFVLIQQLEAHILVPKIMGKAVGLSPVLVILSLAVGAQLLGLTGAILAIPVAAIISVLVGEWTELRKLWHGLDE